jgi:hypothetical protein
MGQYRTKSYLSIKSFLVPAQSKALTHVVEVHESGIAALSFADDSLDNDHAFAIKRRRRASMESPAQVELLFRARRSQRRRDQSANDIVACPWP